jgi:CDP-diacylglycerol---serine O-phosphatidyltransferase
MIEPRFRRRSPRPRGALRDPGIPLRAVLPNTITAMALCSGLTAIRSATLGNWELAVLLVLLAAVLDGVDGRVARLVRAESRFGAELDSLSDAISFGVAPALILYLWSLQWLGRFGWLVALLLALFCALRLARFNASIDRDDQPHKSAGFLTGVPAPAGALLAMTPLYLWLWTAELLARPDALERTDPAAISTWGRVLQSPALVAPWTIGVAVLMVSSIATFGPAIRLRQRVRFEVVAGLVVLVAALVSAPWPTLALIALGYLATIPFSVRGYRQIRRLRGGAGGAPASAPAPPAP